MALEGNEMSDIRRRRNVRTSEGDEIYNARREHIYDVRRRRNVMTSEGDEINDVGRK